MYQPGQQLLFCADVCLGYSKLQDGKMQDKYLAFWIQDMFPPTFFTSFNFLLMFLYFQAKIHSSRFEILQRFCLWVWVYCKMSHLIYALMQISSPGYYLTWIFPSGKNCHAVEFPGFKCDSIVHLKMSRALTCLLSHLQHQLSISLLSSASGALLRSAK